MRRRRYFLPFRGDPLSLFADSKLISPRMRQPAIAPPAIVPGAGRVGWVVGGSGFAAPPQPGVNPRLPALYVGGWRTSETYRPAEYLAKIIHIQAASDP